MAGRQSRTISLIRSGSTCTTTAGRSRHAPGASPSCSRSEWPGRDTSSLSWQSGGVTYVCSGVSGPAVRLTRPPSSDSTRASWYRSSGSSAPLRARSVRVQPFQDRSRLLQRRAGFWPRPFRGRTAQVDVAAGPGYGRATCRPGAACRDVKIFRDRSSSTRTAGLHPSQSSRRLGDRQQAPAQVAPVLRDRRVRATSVS